MPLSVLRTTTTFNVPSLALDNAQRLLGDKSDGGWAVGSLDQGSELVPFATEGGGAEHQREGTR